MKATNDQLLESYSRLKSIWRVAEEFGMCGQSVHARLSALNAIDKSDQWSDSDISILTRFYTERRFANRNDFGLDDLAKQMGRLKSNICRKARELGLTNNQRLMSDEAKIRTSERFKRWHEVNEHPRGMLGKTHADDVRKKMSEHSRNLWNGKCAAFINGSATLKALKTREQNGNLMTPRGGVSWKGGEREIGGVKKYFRSSWEANFARFLETMKNEGSIHKWEHEPDTFWFYNVQRGCRMYCPDFKIWMNTSDFIYIEIKGWMDQRSKTKLDRMAENYPEETVIVLSKDDMNRIENKYGPMIDGWELGSKRSHYGWRNGKLTKRGMELRHGQE